MESGGGFTAGDLSTIGGIAIVSLLHSFIPTHWLPFSIVGRAQKWTLSRTLIVIVMIMVTPSFITAALGAVLHVLSTSLLAITAITISNTIAREETVHKLASLLLIFLGGSYVILFLTGKGGHSHSHNQPMEKMAVAIALSCILFCALFAYSLIACGRGCWEDGIGEGNGFELVEGGGRTRDEGVVHSLGQRLGGHYLTYARGVRLPLRA